MDLLMRARTILVVILVEEVVAPHMLNMAAEVDLLQKLLEIPELV
jgi:hypothetical protein